MSMLPSTFVSLALLVAAAGCSGGGRTPDAGATDVSSGQPGGGIGEDPGATTAAAGDPAAQASPGASGSPVPEPTTLLLLGTGLIAAARFRYRPRSTGREVRLVPGPDTAASGLTARGA